MFVSDKEYYNYIKGNATLDSIMEKEITVKKPKEGKKTEKGNSKKGKKQCSNGN